MKSKTLKTPETESEKLEKTVKSKEQIHFEIIEVIARCEPILAHGAVIIPEKKWNDLIKAAGQLLNN